MPLTYALPHKYNAFVSGFTSIQNASGSKRSNFWIIKPIGLSRGGGISLVDNIADVTYFQPIVIQKYKDDPLCFMGHNFNLRVYILVPHSAIVKLLLIEKYLQGSAVASIQQVCIVSMISESI